MLAHSDSGFLWLEADSRFLPSVGMTKSYNRFLPTVGMTKARADSSLRSE